VTIDEAIRDLLDVSTDILSVAVLDEASSLVAAGPDAGAAAASVAALWDVAVIRADAPAGTALDHVVVPDETGVVTVVAAHGYRIAALTGPRPSLGLLLFDLRTCLGDAFGAEEGPQ
jgi:hypothetical protein